MVIIIMNYRLWILNYNGNHNYEFWIMNYEFSSFFFSFAGGKIRFKITPTIAERPIPLIEKLPHCSTAPPIPIVNVTEIIMILRVRLKSTLCWIRFWIPTDAIVPKSNSMIPPKTAEGILCKRALNFPITEKTIAVAAAIRITWGWVTFVILIAPVTSL